MARRRAQIILVFDGECGFCRGCVRLLSRLDRHRRVLAVPYQRPGLCARLGLTREQAEAQVWAVRGRRAVGGAHAVAVALDAALGTRCFSLAYLFPPVRNVSQATYRWVAAHRGRLPFPRR